uniref:Pre-mRNA processing factor 4 (PRP4)-like domain-containing protein n=1 Tax=Trichogramma kaykai TaxID=54128 RepID=A0ABD2WBW2_9HYME
MPGNIYTLDQYFELETSMSNYRQTREELERKKKAKEIILPKDDSEVKEILWRLEQPTSLFAEGPDAMRRHLRKLMSCSGTDAIKKKVNERLKQIQENLDKIWSNEHPDSLRLVRLWFSNSACIL